jgi:hypothetical protein
MPNTFTLISAVTVGSGGQAAIDFTSIPSTYTDLVVKLSTRNTGTDTWMNLKFNGSSSNWSMRYFQGSGSAVSSGSDPANTYSVQQTISTNTANTFGNAELYIPNYTSSNNKSVSIDHVTENNATTAYQSLTSLLWSNSAAINQVTITPNAGTFAQYSAAYLYGIVKS